MFKENPTGPTHGQKKISASIKCGSYKSKLEKAIFYLSPLRWDMETCQEGGGFMPSVPLFGSHSHQFGSKCSML